MSGSEISPLGQNPIGLLGTKRRFGCFLPSGWSQKSLLAAGCQAQGAAVLHRRSLALGNSPVVLARALHPLCFLMWLLVDKHFSILLKM